MHKTIIQANTPWWNIPFGELVEYRDLLRMLILRDLSTLYKQTILGPLWFFIQPFVRTFFKFLFRKDIAQREALAKQTEAQGAKLRAANEPEAIEDIVKRVDEIREELKGMQGK